jgi:ABC-type transporter Mla subunit MlaD
MSRRASTFDRLALKEQVLINRQMRGLGELNNEFEKIDQMRQKLDEMAREQVPNDGEQIAGTFRVTAQLNHQIRKQLETASNRCDHLAIELQNMRKKIALSGRRREKSAVKADELRTKEHNERERKREDDEASRRRANQA